MIRKTLNKLITNNLAIYLGVILFIFFIFSWHGTSEAVGTIQDQSRAAAFNAAQAGEGVTKPTNNILTDSYKKELSSAMAKAAVTGFVQSGGTVTNISTAEDQIQKQIYNYVSLRQARAGDRLFVQEIASYAGISAASVGGRLTGAQGEAVAESARSGASEGVSRFEASLRNKAAQDAQAAALAQNKSPNQARAEGIAAGNKVTQQTTGTGSALNGGAPVNNGDDPCSGAIDSWRNFFPCTVATIGGFILKISSWALYIAGWAFDKSITYSLDMVKLMSDMPIVNTGWVILRDLTNLGYIFLLLFIAINIILGNSKYGSKELIAKVIITAMLVNFSLFGTKLVIDASNIVALQFYNAIQNPGANTSDIDGGITSQFMNSLNLTSVYRLGQQSGPNGNGQIGQIDTRVAKFLQSNPVEQMLQIGQLTLLGSIFILATAVVFFAGAFMFLARSIILILLMMLSAAAFAARVLPSTKTHFDKWLGMLINQAIFAPVFVGLIYILITAMNAVNPTGNSKIDFASMILTGGFVSGFMSFALILGALVGILLISAKLGAVGGETFHKFLNERVGTKNWFGTGKLMARTVGGGISAAANSRRTEKLSKFLGRAPLVGGIISKGLMNADKIKFGSTSHSEIVKKDKAAVAERYKWQTSFNKRQGVNESDEDYKTRMSLAKDAGDERALAEIGMKKDPVTGKIGLTRLGKFRSMSILGNKGLSEFHVEHREKAKKSAEQKVRSKVEMESSIDGVNTIIGHGLKTETINGKTKNVIDSEVTMNLAAALQSDKWELEGAGSGKAFVSIQAKKADGTDIKIDGTGSSKIDKLINIINDKSGQYNKEERRDAEKEIKLKMGTAKSNLKSYRDALNRAEDQAERAAGKKKDSEPKEEGKDKDHK